MFPVFHKRQACGGTSTCLRAQAFFGVAPEEDPVAHPHVARTALEVPLVDRVVGTAAPYEVLPLSATLLPTVHVDGEGQAKAVRLVMQRNPEKVHRTIPLVARENGKLVKVDNRRGRRTCAGRFLGDDSCASIITGDNGKVERFFQTGIEGVRVEHPAERLFQKPGHLHLVDIAATPNNLYAESAA